MKIKSQKDFFSGVMFAAVGGAFAIGSTNYNVGDAARMGPGYFPLVLGILLAILGLTIVMKAMSVETEDGERVGRWAWRPLCMILLANCAFGVLLGGLPSLGLPPMGMILAIYALTFIASLAGKEFNVKQVAILATVLAVGSYVAFVWMLNLQMPVWPTFLA